MKNIFTPVSLFLLFYSVASYAQNYNIPASPWLNSSEDAIETGVIIIDTDELIAVNPNPAQNFIQFTIQIENKKLTIINQIGFVVMDQVMSSPIVDVSTLQNGIYFFMVSYMDSGEAKHGSFFILR